MREAAIIRRLRKAGIYAEAGLCDLINASDGRHQIGRVELLRRHQKNAARAIELGAVLVWLLKERCTIAQIRMINGLQRPDKASRTLVKAVRAFTKARAAFEYPNWPDVKRHERKTRRRKHA